MTTLIKLCHLKGIFLNTDKYNRAYINFLPEHPHTKTLLTIQDKKFRKTLEYNNITTKKGCSSEDIKAEDEDIEEIIIKTPIRGHLFIVCLENARYYNKSEKLISTTDLESREILITASLSQYTFYKNIKKKRRCIRGWRIKCKRLQII